MSTSRCSSERGNATPHDHRQLINDAAGGRAEEALGADGRREGGESGGGGAWESKLGAFERIEVSRRRIHYAFGWDLVVLWTTKARE